MVIKMTSADYKKLCRRIHRTFAKRMNMPYWESCDLAFDVSVGRKSEKKLFEELEDLILINGEVKNPKVKMWIGR